MEFKFDSIAGPLVIGPSEGPTEIYMSNAFVEVPERSKRSEIGKREVINYKAIQKLVHPNLLSVLQVDETDSSAFVIYSDAGKGGTLCSLEEARYHSFFSRVAFNAPYRNANIKLLVHDVMNGLVALHSNDLHHGNLGMATVYFYLLKDSRRPVFKLGGFKRNRVGKRLAMLQDWKDFGSLLESLMDKLYAGWRTHYLYREFLDLCTSLKHDAMGINTYYKRSHILSEMSQQCKQYVIEHPGMLDNFDRTSYILSACTFIEREKLEREIKDENFDKIYTVDGRLVGALKAQGSIGKTFLSPPVGRRGAVNVLMERNLLGHQPLTGILEQAFGTTSYEIESYFREHQPNTVLVLYYVVKGTLFNFESFVSMNPEALLLR